MVRGGACVGGEEGPGEARVERKIDKGSIQSSQSRLIALVAPGKEAVQERKLNPSQAINTRIKLSRSRLIEISRILLSSISYEVEVPNDQPGGGDSTADVQKLIKEIRGETMVRWGIYVGYHELIFSRDVRYKVN
jgi:hypothetical protein